MPLKCLTLLFIQGNNGHRLCFLSLYLIPHHRRLYIKIFLPKKGTKYLTQFFNSSRKSLAETQHGTGRADRLGWIRTLKTGPTSQWQSQDPDWTRARPLWQRLPRSRFLDTCRKKPAAVISSFLNIGEQLSMLILTSHGRCGYTMCSYLESSRVLRKDPFSLVSEVWCGFVFSPSKF